MRSICIIGLPDAVSGPGTTGQLHKDWNKTSNRVILTILLIITAYTWYTRLWYVEATVVITLFVLT